MSLKLIRSISVDTYLTLATQMSDWIAPKDSKEGLETDCFITLGILAAIFSGEERAKQNLDDVTLKGALTYKVMLKPEPLDIEITDLFVGMYISDGLSTVAELTKNFHESVKQYLSVFREESLKMALQDRLPFVIQMMEQLPFNFNESVHDSLVNRISINSTLVNPQISAIYYIVMMNSVGISHALTLEQFYHPTIHQPYVRIYQSWAKSMSLQQFLEVKYKDIEYLTTQELQQFLDDLKSLTCNVATYENRIKIRERCFGTSAGEEFTFTKYDPEKGCFTGLNLRYVVDLTDPSTFGDNYQKLLKNHLY